MNSVEWNPKYNLLAYAGDDKNKYQADEGIVIIDFFNFISVTRHLITIALLIHTWFLIAGVFRVFGFESTS